MLIDFNGLFRANRNIDHIIRRRGTDFDFNAHLLEHPFQIPRFLQVIQIEFKGLIEVIQCFIKGVTTVGYPQLRARGYELAIFLLNDA